MSKINILLSCPHTSDKNSQAITIALAEKLNSFGFSCTAIINQIPRKELDANRPWSREISPFREKLKEEILKKPDLLIDIHTMSSCPKPISESLVLLYTKGVQNLKFYKEYVGFLREAAKKTDIKPKTIFWDYSEKIDDINIEARELGMKPDQIMLCEHCPEVDENLYAGIHLKAIRGLFNV